ncbi:hypothetical protein PG991_011861 [Apiospora marii]|uniref:Uncharacterized protein n=1 Tax=Apiospora marii TaxID=335849 RepID=A0ABR1RFS3_9PEZI
MSSSWPNRAGGRNPSGSPASASGWGIPMTPERGTQASSSPSPAPQSSRYPAKPIEIKHCETDENFYNQFQCLVQHFNTLGIFGGNTTYEFFDTRFVLVLFRDHLDKDGKWLAKDILLTPCNPSIQLTDIRLHSALMDGYWKLSRWLARLMSGDKVNLYTFLKDDLQNEVKAKKERTI